MYLNVIFLNSRCRYRPILFDYYLSIVLTTLRRIYGKILKTFSINFSNINGEFFFLPIIGRILLLPIYIPDPTIFVNIRKKLNEIAILWTTHSDETNRNRKINCSGFRRNPLSSFNIGYKKKKRNAGIEDRKESQR